MRGVAGAADYGYDDLQRLISSAGDESLSWSYDSVGNRVTQQLEEKGLTTTEYLYVSGTSRLDSVTITEEGMPPVVQDVTLDAAGNVTSDDVSTFLYGPRGTLLRQPSAGTGFAYLYDADGRRVRTSREVNPATTVRHFLLPDGTPYLEDVPGGTQGDRSFVFLGGSLLAMLDDSGVARHVFSDHIGFPVAVADDEEKVNWQAVSGPFGEIEDVVAGDVANDPLLRYPGQWEIPGLADSGNTRLFYNTHRWYNPAWGRYTQADPIGPISLDLRHLYTYEPIYAYAFGNPLTYADPLGLTVTIDDDRVANRYGQLKQCSQFFRVLASNFEAASATFPVKEPTWTPKSCNVGGIPSQPSNTIWIPGDLDCRPMMRCLLHEFYELWMITWGGFSQSGPAGPAHNQAAGFEGRIPMDECCPCQRPGGE